jgi:hypothetical protein
VKFEEKVKTALDETRMLILGAQILLGFGFNSVFRDAFDDLPKYSRYLDAIGLLLMVVTVAFLIAPDTYHRIVEEGRDTGRLHQFVSHMADCSLLPFAGGLAVAMFIGADRIFGLVGGYVIGLSFLTLALICWFGIEYVRRQQAGQKERAVTASQRTMVMEPSIDQRITQMLTEARVVLPGAQALLGFQLTIIISRTFDTLPMSLKIIHAASLSLIAVATILLVTPAAYHRIVFAGENSGEMLRVGGWLVTAATGPLALGLAGDIYVVIAKIADSAAIGAVTSGVVLLMLVGLWHVVPLIVRRRRKHRLGPDPLRKKLH